MKKLLEQQLGFGIYALQQRDYGNNICQVSFFVDRKHRRRVMKLPHARITTWNNADGKMNGRIWVKLRVQVETDSLIIIPEPNGKNN